MVLGGGGKIMAGRRWSQMVVVGRGWSHTLVMPVSNINDKFNVQLENKFLPDLRRNPKTVKLPSIEIKSFSGELTEWPSFLGSYEAAIHNSSELNSYIYEVT